MAGSWTQIDPRLRDDEDYTEDEDEWDEDPAQESQLGYNPQISSSYYDAHLDHARQAKKQLLQRRFENIFAKYGRDFEGVGDEIEMETGLIVVDNGHLKNMQHEGDPGFPEAAEFAHPPVGGSLDSALVDDIDQNMTADSDSDEDSEDEETADEVFSAPNHSDESNTPPFETEESSAEAEKVLAIDPALDNGVFNASRRVTRSRAKKRKRQDVEDDPATDQDATAQPRDLSEHLESLKASMLDLQSKHKDGQGVNSNDIEALGLSIARQLADFVNPDKNSSKPQWNKSKDPVWSYPELPKVAHQGRQPRRVRSPSPLPILTGPSPGQKSLWAPIEHPQARKKYKRRKRKTDPEEDKADNERSPAPAVHEAVEADQPNSAATSEAIVRKCVNCECTSSLIWRSGPDGQLCNACGMYYYRYGLIRPLEAPADSDDSDHDDASNGDPEDQHTMDETIDDQTTPNLLVNGRYRGERFTLRDDAMLIKLKEIDRLSWERIAKHFAGRTAYGVQCRYSKKLHNQPVEARAYLVNQGFESRHDENGIIVFAPAPQQIKGWTDQEDDLLLKLRDEDKLEWDTIADSFPGRNARSMERRFTHLAKRLTKQPGIRRKKKKQPKKSKDPLTRMFTKYTIQEDDQLVYLREVEKLSWADIALRLPGRNAMAMQKRYVRELAYRNQELGADPLVEDENGVLRPTRSKHSRFTREEDIELLHLRNDLELGWKEIEFKMPGRKWQSLENRYQYITKGFERYVKKKGKEAALEPSETAIPGDGSGLDHAQSEDELMQDKEDQSTIAPCSGPCSHTDPANGAASKDTDGDQTPSPQGHGFFSEGDIPFTAEEDSRIRQMRELDQLQWDAIAAKLPGRSVAAVSGRYYRHLFPRSESVNPGAKATPVTAFTDTNSLEIASRINISSSEIASKRSLRWTKEESDLVLCYFNQGLDFEQIGEKMPWRTHKAIQHHYMTKLSIKKSTGKLVAPSAKNNLLRHAVGNTTRHSIQAASMDRAVVDLTGDDGDDESPSRRAQNADGQSRGGRQQLRKLLPRPTSDDERSRMHRKYAPELCTPPRIRGASATKSLPHAHPPKTPGVDAYASVLSAYLSSRASPNNDSTDSAPYANPLTPIRVNEFPQPSTALTIRENDISYSTPAANNAHTHPYFVPPPDASSGRVPLFSGHGFSTQRSVIDPRLLEDALAPLPPSLKLARPAEELVVGLQALTTSIPDEFENSISSKANTVDGDAMFVDISDTVNDTSMDYATEQFTYLEEPEPSDVSEDKADQSSEEMSDAALGDDRIPQANPMDEANDLIGELDHDEYIAFNDEAVDVGETFITQDVESHTAKADDLKFVPAEGGPEPVGKTDLSNSENNDISLHDSGFFEGGIDTTEVEETEDSLKNPKIETSVGTPQPSFWNDLLVKAFETNGSTKPMNVKDIYKFIEGRYPCYKNNASAWRDGVQTCLDDGREFVKVSRSRPLWMFKKALQQDEPARTVQLPTDEPKIEADQPTKHEITTSHDIDEYVEEPVRLITVRSLRERPSKPEPKDPVKKGPARPRKASKKQDEADSGGLSSTEPKQPHVETIADEVDELAPSPEKLLATRMSINLPSLSATPRVPSNDFERLHAPINHHSAGIYKNMHGHPQPSTDQSTFLNAADAPRDTMEDISNVASSVIASSSPLRSLKTPGTTYSTVDTPGTSKSTLFGRGRPKHRGVAALRSSVAPEFARSRSSSVALPNSRKRVIYTPMRDVEGDEDELG